MGDSPKRGGTLMPPATTRRLPDRPAASTREARIAPPYVPSASQPASAPESDYREERDEVADVAPAPEPEPLLAAAPEEDEFDAEPEFTPPAPSEFVTGLEFPLDAFIVPEQAQHVPSGLEGTPATPPPEHTPANSLAERLEKLSHRLRVEDSDAIVRRLASGDRLDSLLAGLLAGYLAGKSEQQ